MTATESPYRIDPLSDHHDRATFGARLAAMALFAAASLLALMGLALVYASREVRLGAARSAARGRACRT